MRNEFRWPLTRLKENRAGSQARRASTRANAARTDGRDFDRGRNAADRQSTFNRARPAPSPPTSGVVITRSGKIPRHARFFTDRFAKNSLVYQKMPLGVVLAELGQKKVTSA